MKERIVIKDEFWVKHFQEREKDFYEEDMCSGGNPEEWWHYEKEQVPETFEELKTMCEELEGQTMDITCDILKDEIDVTIWNIDRSYKVGFAKFYYDGDKVHLFMGTGFSIPIEIPKIWSFIKSLIGEE